MSPVDTSHVFLWARDAVSEIESAPQTFTSWDKCMEKSYCKWPVIAGIIIGGLIILSVVACVVNCLCCGIRCCTGCCGCCCPAPRHKRTKYLDDPYSHPPPQMPPSNPYQSPPAPHPPPSQALPTYRGAQVARFDSPSSPGLQKVNEDALPAMPSWDSAVTRRVEDHDNRSDAMEMEPLNPPNHMPRRMPSEPRVNGAGYMGPPPSVRTGTPGRFQEPRGYDDHNQYAGAGYSPASPYDHQPYHDYPPGPNPGHNFHTMSPPPNAYSTPQQYMPVGMAISTQEPRPIPYRQPSPGFVQPQYRGMSPSIPSSPPPPFSATPASHEYSDPDRPPSLLQSGRKPVPNSYRDV